jgi:hypothetical protein
MEHSHPYETNKVSNSLKILIIIIYFLKTYLGLLILTYG